MRPMTATTEPAQLRDGADRLSARAWGVLLVLCGALFLDALDVSMAGVALPAIGAELGMSTSELQWVVSGYVLGFGGFLLLGGRAADLLGRRRVFLVALGVFAVASGLGALAGDGTVLVASRFVKGVAAAFTAPAGLSIITTSFAEGPARNKALAVYTATGASGFSLGLVFSGLLTELGWRWVFLFPVPLALATLLAAIHLVPGGGRPARSAGGFDVAGALALTTAMLLLVFTLVEAPAAGWVSARTLVSGAAVVALLATFAAIERRAAAPLVRLGILRSSDLARANVAAMALLGGWIGTLFVLTLYMQSLRGWSALEMGLAVFPAGAVVVAITPYVARLVERFGSTRMILAGLTAHASGYALLLPIGLDSTYAVALLPTFLLVGLGFGLAYGPLNIAATNGVAAEEQGLAGGLVITSLQLGGALVLAVVTAVNGAATGPSGSAQSLLDGYQAAIAVSLAAALLGVAAVGLRRPARRSRTPIPTPCVVSHPAGRASQ
jgi:MFS family permease